MIGNTAWLYMIPNERREDPMGQASRIPRGLMSGYTTTHVWSSAANAWPTHSFQVSDCE